MSNSSKYPAQTHGLFVGQPRNKVPKVYQAYRGLINRCYRAKTKGFEHYGGRGITVCDRWRFGEDGKSGFECFLADMGEPPTPAHTIDRRETNGNYEPSNCRWATWQEQHRNKTNNRHLTAFGKTQLMEDWAREYKMDAAFLYNRIFRDGKSVEDALTAPIRKPQLSDDTVRAIRRDMQFGLSRKEVGCRHGTSIDMVWRIFHGKAYRSVV